MAMGLDADAANLLQALRAGGFTGFAQMGVDGARQLVDAQKGFGDGFPLWRVEDDTAGDTAVPVRLYRPSDQVGLPLIVFFHGGGWVIGSLDSHDPLCRRLAAATGCVVAAVDYRLAPEHPFPAAVDDAWHATRWLVDHAEALGVDAGRVAVVGDSAGGNLAAVVARLARDEGLAVRLQVLIYPVIDRRLDRPSMTECDGFLLDRADMAWFWAQYDPDGVAQADPRAVPLAVADLGGLPPALIVTAELDPLRDEGEEYGARLRDQGVTTTVRRYDGTFHGFASMPGVLGAADRALDEIGTALRQALHPTA